MTQPCRPGQCINHNQKSEIISAAAVYHKRGIAVYQQRNRKQNRKHFWSTQLCRPGQSINHDQQRKVSVAHLYINSAVYLFINSNRNLTQKGFRTSQPCRYCRCFNHDLHCKYISGAAEYIGGVVAVYQQPSKSKAKERVDCTAMSARAV